MKQIAPYILSFSITLLMLGLHLFSGINTMINGDSFCVSNTNLAEIIDLHKNHPVFFKRQFTTGITEFFSQLFSIEIGYSFVLVNFMFFFICGPLLYYLSKQIAKNSKVSLLSVLAFYLCFSNLFAFFPPVYTYDEPLQFCFIFLSFIFFFKERFFWFILTFSLALITRESALILLPALFAFFVYDGKIGLRDNLQSISFIKKSVYLISPIFTYSIYIYYVMQNSTQIESSKDYFLLRFSRIGYNFQNFDFIIETIGAILIIYLIPLYFLSQNFKDNFSNEKSQKFIKAFFLTFVINTIIVLFSARVRELRLLVLPLFFLWPIFGIFINKEMKLLLNKQNYLTVFIKSKNIFVFLFLSLLNYIMSFKLYHTTIGPKTGVFNVYLFLSISIIILHLLLKFNNDKKQEILS